MCRLKKETKDALQKPASKSPKDVATFKLNKAAANKPKKGRGFDRGDVKMKD